MSRVSMRDMYRKAQKESVEMIGRFKCAAHGVRVVRGTLHARLLGRGAGWRFTCGAVVDLYDGKTYACHIVRDHYSRAL